MRILLWHVHGGWTDAFVRGRHEYLLPVTPERDGWGLGRAGRDWPASVVEVSADELADADIDVVVLQRVDEIQQVERLTGRVAGADLPAVFVEHNTPKGAVPNAVHPLAEQSDIPIVHVTHFNRLFWDNGRAHTIVVEHGVADPGHLYTGEIARCGVVINDPVRRWRVTGTDLLPGFAAIAPIDVFGMGADGLVEKLGIPAESLRVLGDVQTAAMHAELARRRVYLHPLRWTSLGLSLLEAMHIGLPVVALDATEASRAVPPEAGVVSSDLGRLHEEVRRLIDDPTLAAAMGAGARAFALAHYGLAAFHDNWDTVLFDLARSSRHRAKAGTVGSGTVGTGTVEAAPERKS